MNLHLLRLFVAVADRRSFSAASEALNISQPAVSKGVKELELQLGSPLFERRPRDLRLTEAGRVLARHGRALFAVERNAQEDLNSLRGLKGGALRLGASTTVAAYFLPPALSAFHKRHPDVELRLKIANTSAVAELLADRELDVALVEGPVEDEGLEAEHWREDRLALIAATAHPFARRAQISPRDLSSELILVREPGSGTRQVVIEALERAGAAPRRTLEIGGGEAIANAVAAGLGIAFVSEAIAESHIALGVLKKIKVRGLEIARWLNRVYLPGRMLSPAAAAFEKILDDARDGKM